MSVWLVCCASLCSLAAGVLAVLCWLWVSRPHTSVPGPPTIPLLGNAQIFLKLPVLLGRLKELHRRYGDVFRLYVGPRLIIVTTQPEDVQRVLVSTGQRERHPHVVHVLRRLLGDGLFISNGERWKSHRKVIESGFRVEVLGKYIDKFNECGSFLCEKLAESGGTEVDLRQILVLCTLRTLMATVFGIELDCVVPDPQKQMGLTAEFAALSETLTIMVYRPWMAFSSILWATATGRAMKRQVSAARNLMERGISCAKENLFSIKARGKTPFISLMDEESSFLPFNQKELCDEIMTLGSAGTQTTSDAIGYIFTLLGLYPEWQDMAQHQLNDVFGEGGDYLRPATAADIAQLTVIDAIVKETLRLFPTGPTIPHLVTDDIPLAGGRYVAPRGSTVLVAIYMIHRHPELYPEPEKFDPGRFLPGGSAESKKTCSYVPFGVGSRKCVGERFALLEMKTVVAMVLRRYRILPGSSREDLEESVMSITSNPVSGFRITCVPRDDIPSKCL